MNSDNSPRLSEKHRFDFFDEVVNFPSDDEKVGLA
jgi:hypothetical protein